MEKVTEKDIVEKFNKDLEALDQPEVELSINWYTTLLFALKRKINYERMRKETYERELNYENVVIKHCQKQLKMTDDEVFKMARHYYLDVNGEVKATPNVQVEVKETKSDPISKKKEKTKDYDQFNIFDMLGE